MSMIDGPDNRVKRPCRHRNGIVDLGRGVGRRVRMISVLIVPVIARSGVLGSVDVIVPPGWWFSEADAESFGSGVESDFVLLTLLDFAG